MSTPSLKKLLISELAYASVVEELKNNEVFLVTPVGIIRGRPVDREKPGMLSELVGLLAEKHMKDIGLEEGTRAPGNDGYFVLQNAVVKEGNNSYKFGELVVFYDQIIGISLGKPSEND